MDKATNALPTWLVKAYRHMDDMVLLEDECSLPNLFAAIAYAHEQMSPGIQIVISQPGRLWASYTSLGRGRIRAWLFTPTGLFEEVRDQCWSDMERSSAA